MLKKINSTTNDELRNIITIAMFQVTSLKRGYEDLFSHEFDAKQLSTDAADKHPYCKAIVCLDNVLEMLSSLPVDTDDTEVQMLAVARAQADMNACFQGVKRMLLNEQRNSENAKRVALQRHRGDLRIAS